MDWSVRRLNRAARLNGARTYLEIGVLFGGTFAGVNVPVRHGVDPHLRVEPQALTGPGVELFSMTSDRFFSSGNVTTYDLVMIDGLHTYEQVFRDFLGSMSHAHERTIWLIDDTLPNDVYSSLRDHDHAMAERHRAGSADPSWHGDVFKIVPTLHDFFPMLSYATIVNSGNPQTLVWRQPRPSFRPWFNDLERISRLTYFDISSHSMLFDLMDEQAAFSRLETAFDCAAMVRT
jgi:hypothetical protein